MHRNPDRPGLIGDRACDCLPNPPGGVGAELESLVILELLDRPDQAQVPFLDQVEHAHAPAAIFLGDAYDQPQVRLGERYLGAAA